MKCSLTNKSQRLCLISAALSVVSLLLLFLGQQTYIQPLALLIALLGLAAVLKSRTAPERPPHKLGVAVLILAAIACITPVILLFLYPYVFTIIK